MEFVFLFGMIVTEGQLKKGLPMPSPYFAEKETEG